MKFPTDMGVAGAPESFQAMAAIVGHSVILGIFLMIVSIMTTLRTSGGKTKSGEDLNPIDVLYNSSNVLYFCVGMTAVMLLVNNSLARAFAIGAAIALVRFRIKMDTKNFAMCLFYGVVIGMSCGVEQIGLAYGLAGIFALLQTAMHLMSKFLLRSNPKSSDKPMSGGEPVASAQPVPGAPVLASQSVLTSHDFSK